MNHLARPQPAPALNGWPALHGLGALVWALVALGPLAMLLSRLAADGTDIAGVATGLIGERWVMLLVKSITLAAAVSTFAVALSVSLVRWAMSVRSRVPCRLIHLPLLLLLVPPYLHATAWISAGTTIEITLARIGLILPAVPAGLSVIWLHLAAVFPVTLGFTLVGFRTLDPHLTDSARVFAQDWAVFRRIEWPQIGPTVLIGWVLAFLLSLADFSVPSLLQIEVFALEAFVEYSMAADEVATLIVALPQLLIGLALVLAIAAPLQLLATTPTKAHWQDGSEPRAIGRLAQLAGLAAVGFALLQVAIPVVTLLVAALPIENLLSSVLENGREIFGSLITAVLAGMLSVLLALIILPLLTTLPRLAIVLIPMAVPATLVGIGAIRLWTLPGLDQLYNTAALPVVVAVAQFSPIAVLTLYVQSNRCHPALIDAALIFRGDGLATWARVMLPLWAPGLWAGFFAVFGLTLTELTAALLVSPPGQQALTVKIFSLLHYGATERVAALCLVALIGSMVAAATALAAMSWRDRPLTVTR